MLKNAMDNVDTLIQQGKYGSASREIMVHVLNEDLSKPKQEYALQFAIDKVKFVASLDREAVTKEDDTESYIEFVLEDLTRCIIGHLSRKKSLAEAISFTKDFLASFSHKWVGVSALMTEELFHQEQTPSLDLLSNLVDEYLLPTSEQKFNLFLECFAEYLSPIHYVLGTYLSHQNMVRFQAVGDGDLGAVNIGKKYVDHFFSHGHEVMRKQITENYDAFKAMMEEDGSEFMVKAVRELGKEQFIKYFLETEAGSIAGLALSTSLFMKREDAIVYIRKVYERLIKAGYERIAEGLKLYCTNQPLDEDADRDFWGRYFICNPKHVLSRELIIIPDHLAKALLKVYNTF
ncbi:hypothetical protein IPF37_06200 [bacterium]|nr:MAG: hypothetical protein IPF37_06200 [bacterium]